MPRVKTELTGRNIGVNVRLTPEQHHVFQKLGGAAWLREYLADIIKRRILDEKANTDGARKMVALLQARPQEVPKVTTPHRPFG